MDNVIDCEDMFAMIQIENRANRDANMSIAEIFISNDEFIRTALEGWLDAGNGRKDDDYHPPEAS